jgi:hypothetical protein
MKRKTYQNGCVRVNAPERIRVGVQKTGGSIGHGSHVAERLVLAKINPSGYEIEVQIIEDQQRRIVLKLPALEFSGRGAASNASAGSILIFIDPREVNTLLEAPLGRLSPHVANSMAEGQFLQHCSC